MSSGFEPIIRLQEHSASVMVRHRDSLTKLLWLVHHGDGDHPHRNIRIWHDGVGICFDSCGRHVGLVVTVLLGASADV